MAAGWHTSAFFYSIPVDRFADSDGDGVGDLRGLTGKLDYLEWLGVDAIWLLPFYRSPFRDFGYDVSDHLDVEPRLGTRADFAELAQAAAARGIRVVLDLVASHTSSEHPWFQAARQGRDSRFHDWYVWSDEPREGEWQPMFPGEEDRTWTHDDVAGRWYLHRFYSHQPDLNTASPDVQAALHRTVAYWARAGACGFRIDAVPTFLRKAGGDHGVLRALRRALERERPDAVLLGETDVPRERLLDFFGAGDELHLLLGFLLANHVVLALADERAAPLAESLRSLREPPPGCAYANFLRNHDELDLEQLGEEERERVFRRFAPEPSMRVYGRGIRRRLAPLLGDERRFRLALALLFGLPGPVVLAAGDELGLGDDLSRPGREAVRTPMRWQGGGPSVAAQRDDPSSPLGLVRALARARRAAGIGLGWPSAVRAPEPEALALEYGPALALYNLSGRELPVAVDSPRRDVLAGGEPVQGRLTLPPYGFRWLAQAGGRAGRR